MKNFEKWKQELTLEQLIPKFVKGDIDCDLCPANDMCDDYELSCEGVLKKWGEQEAEIWIPKTDEDDFYYIDIDGEIFYKEAFYPEHSQEHLMILFMHNFFKTADEALSHKDEMLKKYKLIYDLGREDEKNE